MKNIAEKLEDITQYLAKKTLLIKYKIFYSLSPINEMNKVQLSNFNKPEEKYCLILVFFYFYAISNIKVLNKNKNNFEKINLKKITKINNNEENLTQKYIKELIKLDENIMHVVLNKVN